MAGIYIPRVPVYDTPSETSVYKKWVERSYGWVAPVILEMPTCYLTFSFAESIRLTAISMACVTEVTKETKAIDQDDLDSYLDGNTNVLCEFVNERLETTTLSSKKFFIGNYTIKASDDQITWTTLFTGSNTTNLDKYLFLNNTAFFRYYRIDIASNASLSTTVFDRNYYGISKLKFYSYQYADTQGIDNVALYEFTDNDNPKIMKISNAIPQLGELVVTPTSETFDVVGNAIHTVISGATNYYSDYLVSLHSVTDVNDVITDASCVATTVSGVGTDTDAAMYISVDKTIKYGAATAELYNIVSEYEQDIMFTATQTFSTPIDTVSWTGTADIVYDTVASGTLVSGTAGYPLTGTTTRTYTTNLRNRADSYRLIIDELTTNSGVISNDAQLYMWGYSNTVRPLDLDTSNSIMFEVTTGEAYNCRLTAWDDVTHSTLMNELIANDHVRVSAIAFCGSNSKLNPGENKNPLNLVYPPAHNRIFKGNTTFAGYEYYYGDFDMVYRYQTGVYGDYLMFKPMLYGIHPGISYGVHDFIVTLHYSYT